MIKDLLQEQTKTGILHNIMIISMETKDFNNLDEKAKELKTHLGFRITIIDKLLSIDGE